MARDTYESPLSSRYADKEMKYIFSPDMKFKTWRKLWIALAEAEHELGLNITQEQIDELKAHAEDINYEVAEEREKIVRHDVMSHVYAYVSTKTFRHWHLRIFSRHSRPLSARERLSGCRTCSWT